MSTPTEFKFNDELPVDMLPITDSKQLRRAIMRDRNNRFRQRVESMRMNLHQLMHTNFELAKTAYDQMLREPTNTDLNRANRHRSASQVRQVWSFVDGVIYGLCNGLLPSEEIEQLRSQWHDQCDEAFGDGVGGVINPRPQ